MMILLKQLVKHGDTEKEEKRRIATEKRKTDIQVAKVTEQAKTNRWLITVIGGAVFYLLTTL